MLEDFSTAPIEPKLKAMLGFLQKMTLTPEQLTAVDVAPLKAVGLSEAAIRDAIWVSTLFNTIDRIADSLGFDVPDAEAFKASARMLLKHGYKL